MTRLAQRLRLHRSQLVGVGILACLGSSQIHLAGLAAVVAVAGIVSLVLGFSAALTGDRAQRERGVHSKH